MQPPTIAELAAAIRQAERVLIAASGRDIALVRAASAWLTVLRRELWIRENNERKAARPAVGPLIRYRLFAARH